MIIRCKRLWHPMVDERSKVAVPVPQHARQRSEAVTPAADRLAQSLPRICGGSAHDRPHLGASRALGRVGARLRTLAIMHHRIVIAPLFD